jgi:hypothetical protein
VAVDASTLQSVDISDVEAFARAAVKAQFPDLVVDGSAFGRLLVEAYILLMQPVSDQFTLVRANQSLRSTGISDNAVDDILANIFVTRRTGSKAQGTVRLFFLTPLSTSVPQGTIFTSQAGQTFFAIADQTITQAGMSLNQSGDFFFFDVTVQAESEGDAFNVAAGDINQIQDGVVVGVVQIANPSPFGTGLPRETNDEVIERAKLAITERSLVTNPGIQAVLRDEFPEVVDFATTGFGDPEMIRDRLTGTGLAFNGQSLGNATELSIGGKVDIYIKTAARETESFFFIANELNVLRGRDEFDVLPISPLVSFVLDGGFATAVVNNPLNTIVTDANAAYGVNALQNKTLRILSGPSRGLSFTVQSNTATTITLESGVNIDVGNSYVIEGDLKLPMVRVLLVEEVDPVTQVAVGNVLVLDADYQINVDNEALNFSSRARLTLELIGPNKPTNLGRTFRVDFETVSTVQSIQDSIDQPDKRVICADLLVKHALPVFLSANFSFKLAATSTLQAQDLVDALVAELTTSRVGQDFEVTDIPVILRERLNLTSKELFLQGPLEVSVQTFFTDGSIVSSVEQNIVSADRTQVILPGTIEFTSI